MNRDIELLLKSLRATGLMLDLQFLNNGSLGSEEDYTKWNEIWRRHQNIFVPLHEPSEDQSEVLCIDGLFRDLRTYIRPDTGSLYIRYLEDIMTIHIHRSNLQYVLTPGIFSGSYGRLDAFNQCSLPNEIETAGIRYIHSFLDVIKINDQLVKVYE